MHGGILRSRGDVKQTTERKMRNGPPSGFAGFAIPSPTTGAVFNSDATYYVALNAQQGANGGWAYERQIALDTATSFTLAVVLLDGAEPQGLTMTAPDGTLLDLASAASEVRDGVTNARQTETKSNKRGATAQCEGAAGRDEGRRWGVGEHETKERHRRRRWKCIEIETET